jgi:hypothetical protein
MKMYGKQSIFVYNQVGELLFCRGITLIHPSSFDDSPVRISQSLLNVPSPSEVAELDAEIQGVQADLEEKRKTLKRLQGGQWLEKDSF